MKIERKIIKKTILSEVEECVINDVKISEDFLIKNNLLKIAYGGGGYLDENRPWVVLFSPYEALNEKRYTELEFEEFFSNLKK
jgi:hypothetical protein